MAYSLRKDAGWELKTEASEAGFGVPEERKFDGQLAELGTSCGPFSPGQESKCVPNFSRTKQGKIPKFENFIGEKAR